VDVLSFGGTKNGLMFGEAIVFLKPELARHFKYHRKQTMQLISKMRYIAAQFEALLENDLWLGNARQANAMARRLAAARDGVPG
jgi:threonine aldolase